MEDRLLEILESDIRIDLILLDLVMPVMNGVEFFENCENPRFSDIPVIVTTQNGEPEMEAQALRNQGRTILLRNATIPGY